MLFEFKARDSVGKVVRDVVESGSRAEALNSLHEKGLYPLSVKSAGRGTGRFGVRLGRTRLIHFTRALAGIAGSKIPLVKGLAVEREECRNRDLARVIDATIEGLNAGMPLSGALGRFSAVFDTFYLSMVKAGERSGALGDALRRLVGELESSYFFRKKVQQALAYPVMVLVSAVALVVFMVSIVIPQFRELFAALGGDMPAVTLILLNGGEWIARHWYIELPVVVVATGLGFFVWRSERGRMMVDRLLLSIPVLNRFIESVSAEKIASSFAMMRRHDVDVLDILDIEADMAGNRVLGDRLRAARPDVERGVPISKAIAEKGFPGRLVQAFALGEEGGNLAEMLAETGAFYKKDIEITLETFMSLLQPIVVLVLGLIVGVIMAALFLPLFSIGVV